MRIHSIESSSYVDGPGRRAVVFLQGCPIHCLGCQNKALWPAQAGQEWDLKELAAHLGKLAQDAGGNLTISGGEPMAQPLQLAVLVNLLKHAYKVNHILVYTGFTLEQLCQPVHPAFPFLPQILSNIDVLVDGMFIQKLDDPFLSHRGSRNQRPIDVKATLQACGEIVTLDWDSVIELVLPASGGMLMPVGMTREFAQVGAPETQRRCGQRSKVNA